MLSALEDLAISLTDSGAVSRRDLIRTLERLAERLRDPRPDAASPMDLVSQSEAARTVRVSRQAVHQWVAKGLITAYSGVNEQGRAATLVSLDDVAVVASRSRESPLSASLRRQLASFLAILDGTLPTGMLEGLGASLDQPTSPERSDASLRVLRDFVTSAMTTADGDRSWPPEALARLAALPPLIVVDDTSAIGRLARSLTLLVSSSDGRTGFDSPGLAMMGLLALGTVGATLDHPDASAGLRVAGAAEATWGNAWIDRMFDLAFHLDERAVPSLVRYTSSLSHLTSNRFYRQAQAAGVSIAHGRSPGLLLPHGYYGEPLLRDILAGREQARPWSLSRPALARVPQATTDPELNPFRMFTFDRGLLDPSIHGVRRYVYSAEDASLRMRRYLDRLDAADRRRYMDLAVANLAKALASGLLDVVSIDRAADFDWWKDHMIRSSPREALIGMRDQRSRTVAHAIGIQTAILPEAVESSDPSTRELLRIYVKNLEFSVVDERYQDGLRRGSARMVRATTEPLDRAECERRAQEEISRLAA